MDSTVIETLQKQAEHERFASASYLALSLWCEAQNLSGFAAFFRKQAAEETGHTGKLHSHLLDRGVTPVLGSLAAPRQEFVDLVDAVSHAVALEKLNTQGVHGCYEAALEKKDYPAQTMLHWFIEEQVEEQAWTEKLLALTRRATCAGGLTSLDRHVVKILTEE